MRKFLLVVTIVFAILFEAGCFTNTKTVKQKTTIKPNKIVSQKTDDNASKNWYDEVLYKKQYILNVINELKQYQKIVVNKIYKQVGKPPQPATWQNDRWLDWERKYVPAMNKYLYNHKVAYDVFNQTGIIGDYNICVQDMYSIPDKKPANITEERKKAIIWDVNRCFKIAKQVEKYIGGQNGQR